MSHYFGIDLGGTNVAMGILDESYQMIAKTSVPTKATRSFSEIVADIAVTAQKFVRENNISDLEYVGLGAPGIIDPHTGKILFANNLGWKNVDIVEEFQKTWNIPMKLANDANCAVFGEWKAGCGVGESNLLMLTLGTGVGGGIIIGNQIYLGGNGLGCELGHTMFQYDGLPCNCGRKGCLEMYLSVTAFKEQTHQAMLENPDSVMHQLVAENGGKISGKIAFQAKVLGDKAGTQVVDTYVQYIADGIVSLFSSFRSPLFVIGGGICNEGEPLLGPVRQRVNHIIETTEFMAPPRIERAQLGGSAGIIGAALLGVKD